MPQVDLETIVCGGDRKIACETLIDDFPLSEKPDPPDYPAESFWLSKDSELDWFDRNAFYERKESLKGNSNSGSISNSNLNTSSTSQRFSLSIKSKASIIGLPKPQKSCYAECKLRRSCRRPANARLFPKKSERTGKPAVPTDEPSSPKVSCIGRVRSKKERSRRRRSRRQSTAAATTTTVKPKKTGIWASFKAILRSGCRDNRNAEINEQSTDSSPRRSFPVSERKISVSDPVSDSVVEPPGLGGMKRFVSGRRSESWGASDVDLDDLLESPKK